MKKYLIVFLITSSMFISAFYISGKISTSRIKELNTVQEKLSLNILSTETRFALLKQASCDNVLEGSNLEIGITQELNDLAQKIKFFENELDADDSSLLLLRERYSLLQIKDYLLVKELAEKCDYTIATILYFYNDDCSECKKQSIVLDKIREDYSHVRVYWLDAGLVSAATDTMKRLFKTEKYPALVVGEDTYDGFTDYKDLSSIVEKWTTKHNALIETANPEVVKNGLDFIYKERPNIEKESLVFHSFKKGIYLYNGIIDDSKEKFKLSYDNEKEVFSLIDGKDNKNNL